MRAIKKLALATAVAAVFVAGPASAVTQLGFILDSSGSIGSTNWNTIKTGLSNAIGDLLPVNGQYAVSIVNFSATATTVVTNRLVDDAGDVTFLQNAILGMSFLDSTTNYAAAFQAMQTALGNMSGYTATYVNFATDGNPNLPVVSPGPDQSAINARNALITAGVDNISIEGIGSNIDTTFLQTQICYPTPCDATSPYDFPNKGFYIPVANAAAYEAAIRNKIQVVTGQVPEPVTLALVGLGMAGVGMARRRAQKNV